MRAMRRFALALWLTLATGACHVVSGLDAFVRRDDGAGGSGGLPNTGGGGDGGEGPEGCTAPEDSEAPCTGEVLWSRQLASTGNTYIRGIDVAADGAVFVVGNVDGAADFGLGPLPFLGGGDGFVLKLAADGTPLWQLHVGSFNFQAVRAVAATDDGGAVIAASFESEVFVGSDYLDNLYQGTDDSVIARIGPNGGVMWVRHFDGPWSDVIFDIDVNDAGEIAYTGGFFGELDIPGGPLLATSDGEWQMFVGMRQANGVHMWARDHGSQATSQEAYSVRFADDGDLVVGGEFIGDIGFGGNVLTSLQDNDSFVVKLAATDGSTVWTNQVTGDDDEHVRTVRTCPDGSLVIGGRFQASLMVAGGDPLAALGGDLFHARLDANGEHLRSYAIGGSTDDPGAYRIADCDPTNRTVVVGAFDDELDYGVAPVGLDDVFVAKLDDSGEAIWVQTFGGSGDEQAKNIAIGPDGSIVVSGNLAGSLTIGDQNYQRLGSEEDAFVIKLAP
jgi:hypothetical protein